MEGISRQAHGGQGDNQAVKRADNTLNTFCPYYGVFNSMSVFPFGFGTLDDAVRSPGDNCIVFFKNIWRRERPLKLTHSQNNFSPGSRVEVFEFPRKGNPEAISPSSGVCV